MGAVCDRAFEVVERLSGAGSEAAIAAELRRAGEAFGYDNFFMTGLPPGPEERLEAYALVSGWPDEWLSRYAGHDYVHVDPVIRRLRRSTMPFMWHEAPYSRDDRGAVRVMAEAPAFGLTAGITVPIHEATGGTAGVCFSARHQVDWGAESRAALHLVAIYAHARAVELLKAPSAEAPVRLSTRETECLRWTAAGKTAWEISVVLNLSEHTVAAYLRSAATKLNAVNRIQAVAEAMRRRLIT